MAHKWQNEGYIPNVSHHKINRVEAVGQKSSNHILKITIFVNM